MAQDSAVHNPKLDAALDAAKKGYVVFPAHNPTFEDGGVTACSCQDPKCNAIGKHPRFPGWQQQATKDEAQIREWWKRYPNANIATPTGAAFGLGVVDLDTGEAEDEANRLGYVQGGAVVKTGRGRQLHFDPNGRKIKNTSSEIASGLDTRGEGGLVILPGSIHYSGKSYEWEVEPNGHKPVAPEWMPERGVILKDASFDTAAALQGFDEGQRNSGAASLAGKLRNSGVPEDAARELVLKAARNSRPPLDDDEALAVLESIYSRYPAGDKEVSLSLSLNTEDTRDILRIKSFAELVPPNKPRSYVVGGLVPERFASAFYGDGGVAKSLNAMHLGQCVARGEEWLEHATKQMPVLYLDFELDEEEQARRGHEVAHGMGYTEPPTDIHYLCAAGATTRETFQAALDFCVEHGEGLLIVDSLGVALEGDAEASRDVLGFFRNVAGLFRAAGITVLLIDHQSKLQAGERYQNKTMFGSVYKSNMVRSVIQFETRDRAEGKLHLTLRHKKTNFGTLQNPFGARVVFEYDRTTIEYEELSAADLAEEGTMNSRDRVLKALEDLGTAYPEDIAEATGVARKTVKNALTALKNQGKVQLTGNTKGQAQEVSLASLPYKGQGHFIDRVQDPEDEWEDI